MNNAGQIIRSKSAISWRKWALLSRTDIERCIRSTIWVWWSPLRFSFTFTSYVECSKNSFRSFANSEYMVHVFSLQTYRLSGSPFHKFPAQSPAVFLMDATQHTEVSFTIRAWQSLPRYLASLLHCHQTAVWEGIPVPQTCHTWISFFCTSYIPSPKFSAWTPGAVNYQWR